MKKVILLFLLAIVISVDTTFATNLRGRVMHQNSPSAQTRVELLFWNDGTKNWDSKGFAVTGNDGFYFFVNLAPGPRFCIRIAGLFYPQTPSIIANLSPPNYQDLPVISI